MHDNTTDDSVQGSVTMGRTCGECEHYIDLDPPIANIGDCVARMGRGVKCEYALSPACSLFRSKHDETLAEQLADTAHEVDPS